MILLLIVSPSFQNVRIMLSSTGYAKTGSSLDLIPALVQKPSLELSGWWKSCIFALLNAVDTSYTGLLKCGCRDTRT